MGTKLVRDPKTGKWTAPVQEKKAGEATPYDPTVAYLAFKRDKIAQIAKAVGFVPTAETDRGKSAQLASVARELMGNLVDDYIASLKEKK